ncbi:hypothetical protein [Haloarchaeobius sp. HRN-SO-5]|uniref:hypothetical protein n=1 Tax=Haloarchaeobius sp. HRN-SO-5 TaxID=3446118 RepID=UPI003EB733CC
MTEPATVDGDQDFLLSEEEIERDITLVKTTDGVWIAIDEVHDESVERRSRGQALRALDDSIGIS